MQYKRSTILSIQYKSLLPFLGVWGVGRGGVEVSLRTVSCCQKYPFVVDFMRYKCETDATTTINRVLKKQSKCSTNQRKHHILYILSLFIFLEEISTKNLPQTN